MIKLYYEYTAFVLLIPYGQLSLCRSIQAASEEAFMENGKRLEFRGGSFCALIPFVIFIVITISLSFFNAADLNMMIGAGVIGLLV